MYFYSDILPVFFILSINKFLQTLLQNFDTNIFSGKLVVIIWSMVGTRKTGKTEKNEKKEFEF